MSEQADLHHDLADLLFRFPGEFIHGALHVENCVHPDIAIYGVMQLLVGDLVARHFRDFGRRVIGKPTDNFRVHLVGLLAVIAAKLVETLSQPELRACIVWRQRRGLAEEGQGFFAFAGAGKNGREVALGVGVFRILMDGLA